ncbi:putative homocitrate synthase protein [Marine Group I thaumarchaeote SCGC AAA799-E16]|uniref:2-isopropylmalate synthase protein n=2 Tax=Marine Group I TaxID=905826 RepID=A0A087RSW6_9ARCH|nr:putative homocitrate synthase protein [Marine Group I thaumarchaeote SCGC AAA799-E16]KFM16570.1 2-isopropylmalate synthase protein [Marine Group I thaumarchaeote SCGC RSA3]
MSIVYVMITCDVGFEEPVINQLKTIEGIKEVIGVIGTYDIIIKLESSDLENLKNIIPSKIRKIQNIRTTLTLSVIESQEVES